MVPPPGKKRRVNTSPSEALKRTSNPATPTAVAAAALSKRRNDSQQANISFIPKEKYSIGLKLLLPESIYPTPSSVSNFCRR